ncbi:MAG: lytic transglycosylase, partial [Acidimicrobiia bacterium]|nr:lytic transglycosylase [Acidimicrobiia bacterium]
PWAYLAAINLMETRLGRIVGVSSASAVGPMQFLPTTWATCCQGDVNDPHDAIMGAAHYLVMRGAPADMAKALFGYNPNAGYVGAVTAYAQKMLADPRAFYGYHGWQVYVTADVGTVRLPVGYQQAAPTPAAEYLASHPEDLAD